MQVFLGYLALKDWVKKRRRASAVAGIGLGSSAGTGNAADCETGEVNGNQNVIDPSTVRRLYRGMHGNPFANHAT